MLSELSQVVHEYLQNSNYVVMTIASLVVGYVALVSTLRFNIKNKNDKLDPNDPRQAFELLSNLAHKEFVFTFTKSLEFALFRTYGVPGISRLLSKTKQLTAEVSKRYDDTDILIREFSEHYFEDDRADKALRRLNYLHGRHAIPNDQMLYTLSVFIYEPVKWIDRFEWRKLTQNEKQAVYTYWREIGIRMKIKDIPPSYEAFEKFNAQYEKDNLVFAESNKEVALSTVGLLLSKMPGFMRGFGFSAVRALMDDLLIKAMGFPPKSLALENIIVGVFNVRKIIIRYLCLPRIFPVTRCGGPVSNQKDAKTKLYTALNNEEVYQLRFNPYDNNYPHGYQIGNIGPTCVYNDGKLKDLGTN